MKKEMTLGELQASHIKIKGVAMADAVGYENCRALHAMARKARQCLLEFKLEDGTIAEDFLDSSTALQKKMSKLEAKAHEKSGGSPEKQRYLLNQYLLTDKSLSDMRDAQEDFWKTKIEFSFVPVFVDLTQIEESEKHNNRLDDKYKYAFERIWPKSVTVDWRGGQVGRNPLQDFIELELDGFIFTDQEEYNSAIGEEGRGGQVVELVTKK